MNEIVRSLRAVGERPFEDIFRCCTRRTSAGAYRRAQRDDDAVVERYALL
jgi:hypothetical protein